MNVITTTEETCTFEDLAKLERAMCKAKSELRITCIVILVLSVVLPFLPPKYSGQKAMLDMMSYSAAAAGIVTGRRGGNRYGNGAGFPMGCVFYAVWTA